MLVNEATKAFMSKYWGPAAEFVDPQQVEAALTAALPFLQGVKVKAGRAVCYVSKDGEAISDILDMPSDFIYDALKSKRRDAPTSAHIEEGEPVEYDHGEAMRILSLCACKTCSGTGERNDAEAGDISFSTWECQDCDGKGWNRQAYFENFPRKSAMAPSPRARALEDHHDLTTHYKTWRKAMHILEQSSATEEDRFYWKHELAAYDRAIPAALRALSSQPLSDGWLPIEKEPDSKQGPFLVTNNPKALNAFGRPSHVWCVSGIYKDNDGSFCAFEGNQKIHGLVMFMPVSAPLPTLPGASE